MPSRWPIAWCNTPTMAASAWPSATIPGPAAASTPRHLPQRGAEAHRIGDEFLDGAHRLRVTVSLRGQTWRWVALSSLPGTPGAEAVRGRFTGYVEQPGRDYTGARPVKNSAAGSGRTAMRDFAPGSGGPTAPPIFFSLRLPVEALREALFAGKTRLASSRPGPVQSPYRAAPRRRPALFDSHRPGVTPPFAPRRSHQPAASRRDLWPSSASSAARQSTWPSWPAAMKPWSRSRPLLTRLIRVLPVETLDAPVVELTEEVATPLGNSGCCSGAMPAAWNKTLSAVATRLSWFVGAMLGAIGLAWLVIEVGIIRRIATLTRRTRGFPGRCMPMAAWNASNWPICVAVTN